MPSDAIDTEPYSARCYCGASRLRFSKPPATVAYCHCTDCRRWTGTPVAAFAAFEPDNLVANPPLGPGRSHSAGVTRWVCGECGSPLAATFDYLPDQVYVPLGIIDQADRLPPEVHCHTNAKMPWLHIQDKALREPSSARARLTDTTL